MRLSSVVRAFVNKRAIPPLTVRRVCRERQTINRYGVLMSQGYSATGPGGRNSGMPPQKLRIEWILCFLPRRRFIDAARVIEPSLARLRATLNGLGIPETQ
jgi:hypothetical protein